MKFRHLKQYVQGVRWRLLLPVFILLAGSLPATASSAATTPGRPTAPLTLTTSPLPITLQASPGETVSTNIKVKQSGAPTEELVVTLLKFGAYGESGQPILSNFGPGDTFQHWVTFSETKFKAADNVWQTIHMTIAVPKSAAFEYNYAVEITRQGDQLAPGGNSEAIAGGTAVLVLMNVNTPNANRSLELKSFSVEHRVVEFLPTTFDAKFYNNGNVYVEPTGDVFITQGSHQIGTIELNDEEGNILAKSYRIFKTEWADGFPYYTPVNAKDKQQLNKQGQPIMHLIWGLPTNASATSSSTGGASTTNPDMTTESSNLLSRLRFGEYTARLVAVYQDDYGRDVPLTSQITFWVIPWRILIAFLLILIVFAFAIYTIVRNIVRRRRRVERLKRKRR